MSRLAVLVVLLVLSAVLEAFVRSEEKDAVIYDAQIEGVEKEVCLYDRVESQWSLEANFFEKLEIGFISAEDSGMRLASVGAARYSLEESRIEEELLLFEEATMGMARLTTIEWEPNERSLSFNFLEATNQVEIHDVMALRRILNMSLQLEGLVRCQWLNPKRLEAKVLDAPEANAIDHAFRQGTFFAAPKPPRRKPIRIHGNHSARLAVPGSYRWGLLLGEEILAESSEVIRVHRCESDESTLVDSLQPRSIPKKVERPPWFEAIGTLALTGKHQALNLPDDELPGSSFPMSTGGSLCFWLFGLESAFPETHRALFFKGDVKRLGGQRTPSAWLLPGSGRLALRLSADADLLDAGVDTIRPAARYGNWTHLAFVWTYADQENIFKYQCYIDGALDSEFTASRVLFNDGPLQIGRDPDRSGPLALFANLRLWSTPLSATEIRKYIETNEARLTPPAWLFLSEAFNTNTKDDFGLRVEAEEAGCNMPRTERLALYETSAAMGDAISARRAAELLLYGAERMDTRSLRCPLPQRTTIKQDKAKALHYLQLALRLNRNDAKAARELGFLLLLNNASQAWGLLAYAAALNDARAQLAMAQYEKGQDHTEAAAWSVRLAAQTANNEFHTPGEQTLAEMDALSEARLSKGPEKGQRGEDDAQLQAQISRADQGNDVEALVKTADLFYWGARGLGRDHARARRYLQRAVQVHDHTHAMALYAAMLLRGEGGPTDHVEALRLYEKAAARGSVAALNGLGYEYFFGNDNTPANQSKAFGYFLEATEYSQDGDSFFNAGHCLHQGLGTAVDLTKAATLYERAAAHFGHFDASLQLAYLRHNGGTQFARSAALAYTYFQACAKAGWLARDLRAGFDAYLDQEPHHALAFYTQAAHIGFPLAAKNAAFLLDRPRLFFGSNYTDRTLAKHYHRMALDLNFDSESALALAGHLLQDGDCTMALRWLSRAAQANHGPAVAKLADLNALGYCLPQRNTDRAERLYHRATELDTSIPMRAAVALRRVALRLGCFHFFFGSIQQQGTIAPFKYAFMDIYSTFAHYKHLHLSSTVFLGLLLIVLVRIRSSWHVTTVE